MSRYFKLIPAVLAAIGVILSSGLLTGSAQAWTSTIVAAVGAALVYFAPANTPAAPAGLHEAPPVD